MLPAVVAAGLAVAIGAVIRTILKILVVRLIIAFGVSIVSYTGYVLFINELKSYVLQSVNSMPADIYQLFLMSGAGTGLGWLFSALTFRVTSSLINRLTFGNS